MPLISWPTYSAHYPPELLNGRHCRRLLLVLTGLLLSMEISSEPFTIEGEYRDSIAESKPPSVTQVLSYDERLNHTVQFGDLSSEEKQRVQDLGNSRIPLIGIHRDSDLLQDTDLIKDLNWSLVDRRLVGTVTVKSNGAKSVRLYLHVKTRTPIELVFFGFNPSGETHVVDSVEVGSQNLDDSRHYRHTFQQEILDFWSPSVEGNVIGIEARLADEESINSTHLSITKLAHRVRSNTPKSHLPMHLSGLEAIRPSSIAACTGEEVACHKNIIPADISDATAKITFETGGATGFCTATLINDRAPGNQHFLITANHCINTNKVARSLYSEWWFQKRRCQARKNDSRYTTLRGGANLIETNRDQDVTLLKLKRKPPAGVYYAGISTDNRLVSSGSKLVATHHALGATKKFLSATSRGADSFGYCTVGGYCGFRKGNVRISYKIGIGQGGASGAGVFGRSKLIGTFVQTDATPSCSGGGVVLQYADFYSQIAPHVFPGPPPPPPIPKASFTDAVSNTDESSKLVNVAVEFEPAPTSSLSLRFTVSGTASSGHDYLEPSVPVVVPADSYKVLIPVKIVGDNLHEGNESVILTLVDLSDYDLGTNNSHVLTITDNDVAPSAVQLSAWPTTVSESAGATPIRVDVSLVGTTRWSVAKKISLSISASLEQNVVQFSPIADFDLTLPAKASSGFATFSLTPLNDDEQTEDETVSITGSLANVAVRNANVVITDDDHATDVPVVSITGGDYAIEGGQASYTVTANPLPKEDLTVQLNVSDASNSNFIAPADEAAQTVTLTTSGSVTYTVNTINDQVDEPDGDLLVSVNRGNGYGVGAKNVASVNITDNDPTLVALERSGTEAIKRDGGTAVFTISLGRNLLSGEMVTVPLSIEGTGISSNEYILRRVGSDQLNSGISMKTSNPHSVAEPAIVFEGHDLNSVKTATLGLTSTRGNPNNGGVASVIISMANGPRTVTSNLDGSIGSDGTSPIGQVSIEIDEEGAAVTDPPIVEEPPVPPDLSDPQEPENQPDSPDDHEPGSTRDTAILIDPTSQTDAAIDPSGDLDYYQFTLVDTSEVTITTLGNLDTICKLESSEEILQTNDDDGTGRNCLIQTNLEYGTYWISVKGYAQNAGSYTLKLTSTSDDISNYEDMPYSLDRDTTLNTKLGYPADVDYFVFDAEGSGTLRIFSTGVIDTIGCIQPPMTDQRKETWRCDDDSGEGRNFLHHIEVTTAGSYLVRVEGYRQAIGNYGLTLLFDEPIDEDHLWLTNAQRISSSKSQWEFQIPRTLSSGETHTYRVELHQSGQLIATTHDSINTRTRLFHAQDLEVPLVDTGTENEPNSQHEQRVREGTYLVVVQGETEEQSGDYLLKIELTQATE